MISPDHFDSDASVQADGNVAKLQSLIAGIDVAMMVTLDGERRPCSRPMTVITIPGESDLWFAAPEGSPVVTQVRGCADVTVQFVSPAGRYVVATGRAHLHRAVDEISDSDSTPDLLPWTSSGVSMPSVMLIHVNVDTVEYWESTSTEPRVLDFVRPVSTGRRGPRRLRPTSFLN